MKLFEYIYTYGNWTHNRNTTVVPIAKISAPNRYSALKAEKKAAALKKWEELYNRFVESMYLELKQEDVATQHRQEQDV